MKAIIYTRHYILLFIIILTNPLQQSCIAMPITEALPTTQTMQIPEQQPTSPLPQQGAMPEPTSTSTPEPLPTTQPMPMSEQGAMPTTENIALAQQPLTEAAQQQLRDANRQELTEINTGMAKIDNLKTELKTMLVDLDTKFDEARTEITEAKKLSFEILKKETEAEAQDLLNKVHEIAQKINVTTNFTQNAFNTSFLNKVNAVNETIATIEGLIATIETRIMELENAQPEQQQLPKIQDLTSNLSSTQEENPVATILEKNTKEPITTRLYNALSSAAARVLKASKKMISWITGPKRDSESTKPVQKEYQEEPRWKKVTLRIVSKGLDLIATTLKAMAQMLRSVYNYFFAASIKKFSHDVETKLIKLEEQEEKKEQAQPPAISTE